MPFNASFYDTVRISTKRAAEIRTTNNAGDSNLFLSYRPRLALNTPRVSNGLTPLNVDYGTNTLIRLAKSPKIDPAKFSESLVNRLSFKGLSTLQG